MSLLRDNHRYSYSQLTSFNDCPFGYYLKYIEGVDDQSNAFAEQGTLIHDILDKWAKKEIKKEDMAKEYAKRYADEVPTAFPRMLTAKGYAEKAFQLGYDYFVNFEEFPGYEIVSAEEKFEQPLKLSDGTERPFIAFVDLVLRNEFTGGLVIVDHKSKSLREFKKHREDMYRQQYIYAYFIHEKYNEWPEMCAFNLFKENGYFDERQFSKEEFDSTINWATDVINRIESSDILDFMVCKTQPVNKKTGKSEPDMVCSEICSVRANCPCSIKR